MKKITHTLVLLICLCGLSMQAQAQACITYAGNDVTICENVEANLDYDLGGNYGYWTQVGSGEYMGSAYGSGTYTYSANSYAKTRGKDTLLLHNEGYYNYCYSADIDTVVITLTPGPSITVPSDLNICSTTSTVALNATVGLATGMFWSTNGSGTISPNSTSATATYSVTASDIASGGIYIIGITSGNGDCNAEDDTIFVTITDITYLDVTVSTPTDVCASDKISANASQTGGPVITTQWASSGTGTFLKPTNLITEYVPSAADKSNGTVILTMTLSGPCPAVTESSTVTIHNSESVSVSVGSDLVACYDNETITVDATTSGATNGLIWSVTSSEYYTGNFIDNTVEDAEYDFYYSDSYAIVTLRLTANAVGNCINTYDELILDVNDPVSMSVYNENVCANDEAVEYETGDGSILSNIQGSIWTSSGTGTFIPDAAELQNEEGNLDYLDYVFSPADLAAGTVTINVVAIAYPGCANQSATSVVTINPLPPTPDAGIDQIICDPDLDNNTTTMAASQNPDGNTYQSYWESDDVSIGNPARTSSSKDQTPGKDQKLQGALNADFYDEYAYNSDVTLNYMGTATFYWVLEDNNTNCISYDSMQISHLVYPDGDDDEFYVPAGETVTFNLGTNDRFHGMSFTATLDNPTEIPENISEPLRVEGDSIYLTYTNRSPVINGTDNLTYTLTTTDCPLTSYFDITVHLLNGPPFTPDTSIARTTVQKAPNTTVVLTLNLSLVYGDYNNNINWATLTPLGSLNHSDVTITVDPVNKYLVTLTYSSERAATFTGEDVVEFRVSDALGATYTGRYYVEIIPDYSNPSVKPNDFEVINAVSPNGDNVNDFMYVYGAAEYHNTVVIYNRWSQKVWEHTNYDNNKVKFEGYSNVNGTELLPEGTYYYVIVNNGKEENQEKKGLYSGYLELRR